MTSTDKIRLLIERLIQRTQEGALSWEGRSSRENAYEADVGTSLNVEIGTVDDDGAAPFDFRIFRRTEGGTWDRVETVVGRPADNEYHEILAELYEVVARNAKGLDQVLDRLLDELG